MRIKNILVANHHLANTGGSETYTYTMIEELVRRGYKVEYFTFHKGEISNRIEKDLSVPFMSGKKYDLILANHNTCVNHLFEKGFIIQTCHGIFPDLEQPSPNADAYVVISEEVSRHLDKLGYNSRTILNGINLNRFKSIRPVKNKLLHVLSLCHSEEANVILREACNKVGATLLVQDKYNDPVWEVELRINEADLVVGVGRSAYEAMACGRPVIIFDHRQYYPSCGDGYVKDMLNKSIINNCSGRFSNKSYSAGDLETELKKYNAVDGNYFRKFAEENLNIEIAVNKYLDYFYAIKKSFPGYYILRLKKTWKTRRLKKK
ncbi:MAG: UDP-glycosyltransferase [Agriterribacter sp.]